MISLVKKIFSSKWFRIFFSIFLFYFAFRKIDIGNLVSELSKVNIWIVGLILVYMILVSFIGGFRWSLLVLKKVTLKDVWFFTKSAYMGTFYGLLFPTAVGGDLIKWLPLIKKYPELSKTRLASSVLLDRIVGFTAFALIGLLSLIIGNLLGYSFPKYLWWLFLAINLGVFGFYFLVFKVNLDKIFERFPKIKKAEEVVAIFKNENKSRIFKCFLISLIAEPVWIAGSWFNALVFNVPISLVEIFIYMPVITLILVLPISVAGFGARENLFLFFFSQLGIGSEKILLMSTFGGILNVVFALFGGIFILF